MNKFLHSPTVALKQQMLEDDLDGVLGNFRRLFGLDEDPR
jgi:glutamyl-tRNA reductase